MSKICKNCNHVCHCDNQEHTDEYADLCKCNPCECGDE